MGKIWSLLYRIWKWLQIWAEVKVKVLEKVSLIKHHNGHRKKVDMRVCESFSAYLCFLPRKIELAGGTLSSLRLVYDDHPSFFLKIYLCSSLLHFLANVESLPVVLHLSPVPACDTAQRLCVFVDLMLKRGSNLPLRLGQREAYWCFSYKSTSRKPRQKCCTASRWISGGATTEDRRGGERKQRSTRNYAMEGKVRLKKRWTDRALQRLPKRETENPENSWKMNVCVFVSRHCIWI